MLLLRIINCINQGSFQTSPVCEHAEHTLSLSVSIMMVQMHEEGGGGIFSICLRPPPYGSFTRGSRVLLPPMDPGILMYFFFKSHVQDLVYVLPLVIVIVVIIIITVVVIYMLYRAKRGYFCCLKPVSCSMVPYILTPI